jgi:hypothetical protein
MWMSPHDRADYTKTPSVDPRCARAQLGHLGFGAASKMQCRSQTGIATKSHLKALFDD